VNHDEFEQTFQEAFEEVLGWGTEIADDDHPGSIEGWDSLAQIRIVHELETRFGVRLPDDALLEAQSVGSLKRLVAGSVGVAD
jgi:acyl carrier protein